MASFATQICAHQQSVRPVAPRTRLVAARAVEDIYIGKGKYVRDEASKYPERTQLTGGWAGGEAGLKKFVEEYEGKNTLPGKTTGPATKLLGGKDVIYTGKGNYVRDDIKKYPNRTTTTGGFAGGERGVGKFVEDGDLSFSKPGEFRPQSSALFVPLIMAVSAAVISSIWFAVVPQ